MIILIAPTFDTLSPVLLTGGPADNLRDLTRRVSRRATLDGSAVAPDYGYSPSDRTFIVDLKGAPLATVREVERMVRTYARLVVVTDEGIFIAAPSALTGGRLTLLVLEQID